MHEVSNDKMSKDKSIRFNKKKWKFNFLGHGEYDRVTLARGKIVSEERWSYWRSANMAGIDRDLRHSIEFIPNRLYYVPLTVAPTAAIPNKHFFCIDSELVYWNFYLDFGPLNLGQLYRFCQLLNKKLEDPKLKDKTLYFYSSSHPHKRANAAFLICAWFMLYQNKSPEEAFSPFSAVAHTFPSWHDATPSVCTFNLTILDTLRGLHKAKVCGFFDFSNFDINEYEHYEQVENGDLNWCVRNKFVAFAGPHARDSAPRGFHTLTPEHYTPYFKKNNVTLVVRLNKRYYEAKSFLNQGIDHLDLYFEDGSNPPDHILAKFIVKCEETPGAVAVHCKAGLGRTGTCIGAYIMKHFRFTAEEIIGWLRIIRPGSIIGPQQQFMKDIQARMWREGEMHRVRSSSLSPTRKDLEDKKLVNSMNSLALSPSNGGSGSGSGSEKYKSSTASSVEAINALKDECQSPSANSSRKIPGPLISSAISNDEKESQGDSLRMRRLQTNAKSPTSPSTPSRFSFFRR